MVDGGERAALRQPTPTIFGQSKLSTSFTDLK
jgi:hypothetical protein